jgi:hypothetical protein
MAGLANTLMIVAVAALVIVRQLDARRVGVDHRWWFGSGILAWRAQLLTPTGRPARAHGDDVFRFAGMERV